MFAMKVTFGYGCSSLVYNQCQGQDTLRGLPLGLGWDLMGFGDLQMLRVV